MSTLDQLNLGRWDSFWMYACAALALIAIRARPFIAVLEILKEIVDFLRSEQAAWLLEQLRRLVRFLTREYVQTVKHAQFNPGAKIKLHLAIGNSVCLYLIGGLLTIQWVFFLAVGTINFKQLPPWQVMAVLAGMTFTLFLPALYFAGQAAKERAKAKRLWEECREEGICAYAALTSMPLALFCLALAISFLQQLGRA